MKRRGSLVALVVAAGLFVGSQFAAGVERGDLAAQQEQLEDQQRQIRKLSLSNCTDLKDQTAALYQLVLILKAIVDGGALGPDAKVRIEEPEAIRCGQDDLVPAKPYSKGAGRPD